MDKELQIYENLWEKVLEINDFCSTVIFFDEILLESEYNLQKSYELLWIDDEKMYLILADKKVEKDRIYISDQLYELFFSYRAILLRSHFLYYNWRKNRNIVSLKEDSLILHHLKQVLDDIEIRNSYKRDTWFLWGINNLLKEKILWEIKKIKQTTKQKNSTSISAWTYIKVGWDIIAWNQNKNSHSNEKKTESWQDNIIIYIVVSILTVIIATLILKEYFWI